MFSIRPKLVFRCENKNKSRPAGAEQHGGGSKLPHLCIWEQESVQRINSLSE